MLTFLLLSCPQIRMTDADARKESMVTVSRSRTPREKRHAMFREYERSVHEAGLWVSFGKTLLIIPSIDTDTFRLHMQWLLKAVRTSHYLRHLEDTGTDDVKNLKRLAWKARRTLKQPYKGEKKQEPEGTGSTSFRDKLREASASLAAGARPTGNEAASKKDAEPPQKSIPQVQPSASEDKPILIVNSRAWLGPITWRGIEVNSPTLTVSASHSPTSISTVPRASNVSTISDPWTAISEAKTMPIYEFPSTSSIVYLGGIFFSTVRTPWPGPVTWHGYASRSVTCISIKGQLSSVLRQNFEAQISAVNGGDCNHHPMDLD